MLPANRIKFEKKVGMTTAHNVSLEDSMKPEARRNNAPGGDKLMTAKNMTVSISHLNNTIKY